MKRIPGLPIWRGLPILVAFLSLPLLVSGFSTRISYQRSTVSSPFDERNAKPSTKTLSLLPSRTASILRSRHLSRQRRRGRTRSDHLLFTTKSSSSDPNLDGAAQTLRKLLRTTVQYTKKLIELCDRPLTQVQQWTILLAYYFFHLMVLSQHAILFGWQLIPNNKGHFCSLGWDSIAGMVSLAAFLYLKRGTIYFRKPWRRLLREDTVEPPKNKNTEASSTVVASSTAVAEKTPDQELDAAKLLESAPQQISLKRSIKPPKTETSKDDSSTKEDPPTTSVSASAKKEDPPATSASGTSTDSSTPLTNNVASASASIDSSTPPAAKSDAAAVPKKSTVAVPDADAAIPKKSTVAVPAPTPAPPTPAPPPGSIPVAQTYAISEDELDKKEKEDKDSKADSTAASSKTEQPGINNDWLKPWNDAFQEFKSILAGDNNNTNTTRIAKQGADIDFSAIKELSENLKKRQWSRLSSFVAITMLVNTYFLTGRFSFFWEDSLAAMRALGFPLSVAMHRSLCVLLGHLTWVAIGSLILGLIPRPRFFGKDNKWYRQFARRRNVTPGETAAGDGKTESHFNWVWWVIGGYSISAWFFNASDFVNLYALPYQVLEEAISQEGVVTQLINPEDNDFLASVVGYIAPCLSAPWWEEVLYRGFFFPALTLFFPVWVSVFLSGVVFSAHHLSLTAALPLAVLGWTWCGLYMASDNLWTTIVVHALWNSRVFLSSWLGI